MTTEKETITLTFEIERVRASVTQGGVNVYCNGEKIIFCGDEIHLLKDGEKGYGPNIGGYASKTKAGSFVKGLLFNRIPRIEQYQDKLKQIIDKLGDK